LDATNGWAELAIRFGVVRRKLWEGALAPSILLPVGRTCWQRGPNVVAFLRQLRRCPAALVALPPE
jgi:hypothetical protein